MSALHYSGAGKLAAPLLGGNGVIFMLHHVTPDPSRDFEPNGILKVTPAFLDTVIRHIKDAGFDCISMDEVPARIAVPASRKRFAAFTLDDGYKDNRDHAYPIFKKHNVPFTVYVPTDFADGNGDLWWLTLEEALRRLRSATVEMGGGSRTFLLRTAAEKELAFEQIYWWMRKIPEDRARAETHRLAREAGFDPRKICRDLVMNWDDLRAFGRDPLVSYGAHTKTHFALAKLPAEAAHREISDSIERLSREFGKPCRHFSYPYGSEDTAGEREFEMVAKTGVATSVTTRKGLIYARHATELSALPRLSLNGDYQDRRYLDVLLSGAPFALWNAARRLKPSRSKNVPAGA